MPRALLRAATLLAALACSTRADAYCRTTTVQVPPGYDPTVNGCLDAGTPIAWPGMPVTYEMHAANSTQVTRADAQSIFDAAFAAWAASTCPDGQHPTLSFEALPPVDAAFVDCDASDTACQDAEAHGPHQILFRDDAWPYDDSANAIALTTVTYGVDTGHIFSADMEINTHDFHISTSADPPSGVIALPAIALHEGGHFIGIAHSNVKTATMYAYYDPAVKTLTPDDVAAVCAVYPPTTGCGCAIPGRAETSFPALALAAALAAVAARSRRREER